MARWVAILLLWSVIGVTSWAQSNPIIDSIFTDGVLPVGGGGLIDIRGSRLADAVCQVAPVHCPATPQVLFYRRYADFCCTATYGTIVEFSDTRILVRTPPHPHGFADIRVINRGGFSAGVSAGVYFGRGGFQRVLVPLAFEGEVPGANGSRWTTTLSGRIKDPDLHEVTRTPFSDPPHNVSGAFTFTDLPSTPGGMFVYVPVGPDVAMSLRIRDVTHGDENLGTQIPLVAEYETWTAFGKTLLNVVVSPSYRNTLRVYDFDGWTGARFTVSILPRAGLELQVRKTYAMLREALEEFPTRPGYAEISLEDLLPEGHRGVVDVELTQDLVSPARLWAMISTTNNETQFVTIVTPTYQQSDFPNYDP